MTIFRTRVGGPPSGGPEEGRSIKQMGEVFVEYTGSAPTQADLDAHLSPDQPNRKAPPPPSGTTVAALRDEVAALRQKLIDAGALVL